MSDMHDEFYDVIIVGAGSAGGTLGARLSQDASRTVLLLEAGPDYGPTAAAQPVLVRDAHDSTATDHDWGYVGAAANLDRELPCYAGKIVGGSSATNNVMALRGHPGDYDAWAVDNPGWGYADVLPAFTRLERDQDFTAGHGRDGPVPIRRFPWTQLVPAQQAFLDTCEALGHQRIDDHNAAGAIGAGRLPVNDVDGVRQSVALTYLAAARKRPNLTLRAGVHVTRVLLERRRAAGVVLADGTVIRADRVVLCAGAYGSPAILMRSGLGPAAQLRAAGVPVRDDRPGVGQNLQDHPLLRIPFASPDEPTPVPRQTLLTVAGDSPWPAPQLQVFLSGPGATDPTTLTLVVSVLKPRSRGRVWITSDRPDVPPRIDAPHLRDPDDVRDLVAAVELARDIAASAPLATHVDKPLWASDGDLVAALRAVVGGYQHAVGTCRMSRPDDPGAVVDQDGRVHGIEDLFVVDASIMPEIPSANTNVPTIMVAEKLADRVA
jgi:choline dehydrogenase